MKTITAAEVEGATFRYCAHGTMGFTDDGRQKGFSYSYRCVEYPRLVMVRRSYLLDDGGSATEWHVDGVQQLDREAAIAALNVPPVLTDDEAATFAKVPRVFVDFAIVWDVLAGCKHPDGAIMPDTPHARALRLLDALRSKGVVVTDAKPWPDDHRPEVTDSSLRWSTTIRRVDL